MATAVIAGRAGIVLRDKVAEIADRAGIVPAGRGRKALAGRVLVAAGLAAGRVANGAAEIAAGAASNAAGADLARGVRNCRRCRRST